MSFKHLRILKSCTSRLVIVSIGFSVSLVSLSSLSLSLWVGRIGPNSRRFRTKLLHVLGTIEPIQPMRHTTEFVLLVS